MNKKYNVIGLIQLEGPQAMLIIGIAIASGLCGPQVMTGLKECFVKCVCLGLERLTNLAVKALRIGARSRITVFREGMVDSSEYTQPPFSSSLSSGVIWSWK